MGKVSKKRKPKGFYSRMSDEELISHIDKNFRGITLREFTKNDPSIYGVARNRGLINRLTDEGILVRQIRHGFFTKMTDDDLKEYIRDNHDGKTLREFVEDEASLYNVVRQRGLVGMLVEEKIITRTMKPAGFYSKMCNDELIKYTHDNYSGVTITQLQNKCSPLYKLALERGLVDKLVASGVVVRKSRQHFFSDMDDCEFIEYINKNHNGKTISELQKNDNQAYQVARNRALIDPLVDSKILVREKRPGKFYSGMSDDELVEFITKNHKGKSINEISGGLIAEMHSRNMVDKLVTKGIIVRERKKSFTAMSDERLLAYVRGTYLGKTILEFSHLDGSTYKHVCKRGLIDTLVDNGILIRIKKHRFFSKMTDDELEEFIRENCRGESLSEFCKNNSAAYVLAHKRGLISRLIEDGILIKKRDNKRIDPDAMRKAILLLKESTLNYEQISLAANINYTTLKNNIRNKIKRGILDAGYRRPNGHLYLENVRRESQQSLEDVLA